MRTATWILTPLLALGLVACGDDGGDTDSATSTGMMTTTGTPMTMSGSDTGSTTTPDPTTTSDDTTTAVDPTTTSDDTTTNDDTTTDNTTSDDTTGGGALSCQAYCNTYKTACKDFSEYDNDAACLAQCSQWPPDMPGAVDGDSLGCRTYHVGVASNQDPEMHCPHSGPSGAGVCVAADAPTCAGYCDAYFLACKDNLNLYDGDMAKCLDTCSDWYQGKKGDTAGDTVGCRDYHAGVALGAPDEHCPHAGPGGADVCVVQ